MHALPDSMATAPGDMLTAFREIEEGDLVHFAVYGGTFSGRATSVSVDLQLVGESTVTLSSGPRLIVQIMPAEPSVGIPRPYPQDGGAVKVDAEWTDGTPIIDGIEVT